MFVLVVGNVVDGLEFYGPFETTEEAGEFAGEGGVWVDRDWTIAELLNPEDEPDVVD